MFLLVVNKKMSAQGLLFDRNDDGSYSVKKGLFSESTFKTDDGEQININDVEKTTIAPSGMISFYQNLTKETQPEQLTLDFDK